MVYIQPCNDYPCLLPGEMPMKKRKTVENKFNYLVSRWDNKEFSAKMRRIFSESNKGEKNHFWKGGVTTYERKLYLNNRRRAKLLNATGSHTQGEWELLKRQYGNICPACEKPEPDIVLTEDHIIPLSKGGSDYIENIQPLCRSCNSRKHTESIIYPAKGDVSETK